MDDRVPHLTGDESIVQNKRNTCSVTGKKEFLLCWNKNNDENTISKKYFLNVHIQNLFKFECVSVWYTMSVSTFSIYSY